MSARDAVDAVHKVGHVNVARDEHGTDHHQQRVGTLNRREADAHQHTDDQLQGSATDDAHAANIFEPAQGQGEKHGGGNRDGQLQGLGGAVGPAHQGRHEESQQGRRGRRQAHAAVGRRGVRGPFVGDVHHVVAVQNRTHRKGQEGTGNHRKNENAR